MSLNETPTALERALEMLLLQRLGAGVYRRWVEGIGLRGDERVLDIGTGTGACARHLAGALPGGKLTCLDLDGRWFPIAHQRIEGLTDVEFVTADACDWSRPNGFDVVTVHFMLHDVPAERRDRMAARIAENLRPGGRVHLREPVTHGMTAHQMASVFADAGLQRARDDVPGHIPLAGPTVSAVWEKRAVE